MADIDLPFSAWLRRQRRARDLTQGELAALVGCAPVTLRKLETGERRPSKQVAESLAAALGVPFAELAAFVAYARASYPDGAVNTTLLGPGRAETTTTTEVRAASQWPAPGRPWLVASSPARRHNLPLQLTSFIGRELQTAEIGRFLLETRLVTLTGAGGSGKTRLALQVAEGLVEDYSDGVWWVDLARLSDAELVPKAVAGGLGLRHEGERLLLEQLEDYLQRRHLLLLLDNCEHLIGACAAFADAFLRVAPRLTILATSRRAVGGRR